jgi:hypothetical protein
MTLPLQILQVLADAAGHPLLKSVLRLQVEARVRPRPLKAVFEAELQGMQDRGLVMMKDNELDPDDPFYLLDEKGEAQAAKLRL